jgi:hypothetical protein
MEIDDFRELVARITAIRTLLPSEYGTFSAELREKAIPLGDLSISYLEPLWQTWPGLAINVAESVFKSTDSLKSLEAIVNFLETASGWRVADVVNHAVRTMYYYATENNNKQADICIKAIRNIAKKNPKVYIVASDNPVKNATWCLNELKKLKR